MRQVLIYSYLLNVWQEIIHPKIWLILSAIGLFISQYIFNQWAFAIGFLIILICDTISGTYVAVRTSMYSGKIFREKLQDKCIAYFIIIVSFSAGTKITLEGSHLNLIEYLNIPFYSLFIVVELRSIISTWYHFKKWDFLGELLVLFSKNKNIPNDENQR